MTPGSELALTYARQRPSDAARVLEAQRPEHAAAFLAEIPTRSAALVLEHMQPSLAAACIEPLALERAAAILQHVPPVQCAAALRSIPLELRERLLGELSTARSLTLRMLLDYPADTVGAWMDPRLFTLPADSRVADALARIGQARDNVGDRIYVLAAEQTLVGEVSVVALVRAPRRASVGEHLQSVGEVLPARRSLLSIRDHPAWSSLDRLPVINRRGQLVGVLHHNGLRRGLAELEPAAAGEVRLAHALGGIAELYWVGMTKAFAALLALAGVQAEAARENDDER